MLESLQYPPDKLKSGQILAQDVMAGSMVWLREGTVLNDAAIDRLRRMELHAVLIRLDESASSEIPSSAGTQSQAGSQNSQAPDFRKLATDKNTGWMSSEHFSRPVDNSLVEDPMERMFSRHKSRIRQQAGFKEMIPATVNIQVHKGLQASMISAAMRHRIDLARINSQADELSDHLVGNGRGYINMQDISTYGEHLTARTVLSSKLFHLTRRTADEAELREQIRCQFMMQGMYSLLPENLQIPCCDLEHRDRELLKHTLLEYCEWVKNAGRVNGSIMENVMLQHERIDGRGLPHGLKGDEIPLDSQTWSLVTSYSSSVFSRPGKPRCSPREAADNLIRQSGSVHDSSVINIFLRQFGYFPNGSLVRLNTGELAIVRQQVERSMFKPVVCRLDSENQPLPETELMNADGVFIKASVLEY